MKITAILLVVALGLVSVCGWGRDGHMAIAQVAATRLSSQSAAIIQKYLAGNTLENIAPLPDNYDHSAPGKWSSPLHYVNLPRDATSYRPQYCAEPPGCVVSAIKNFTDALRREGTSGNRCEYGKGEEPCPIEFLVHFVGDVHQPLHVSYEDDRGGNSVKVSWFGKPTNLHAVWDSGMISTYASDVNTLISDLNGIINNNPDMVARYSRVNDPAIWANESFTAVLNNVYQYDSTDLGQTYYNNNIPIVQQRLIAAAIRLSDLFNSIFG